MFSARVLAVALLGSLALRMCLDYALVNIVQELFTPQSTSVALLRQSESYAWTVLLGLVVAAGVQRSAGVASTVELLYLSFVIFPALTMLAYGGDEVPGTFVRWRAASFALMILVRIGVPDFALPALARQCRLVFTAGALLITGYVYGGLILTGLRMSPFSRDLPRVPARSSEDGLHPSRQDGRP